MGVYDLMTIGWRKMRKCLCWIRITLNSVKLCHFRKDIPFSISSTWTTLSNSSCNIWEFRVKVFIWLRFFFCFYSGDLVIRPFTFIFIYGYAYICSSINLLLLLLQLFTFFNFFKIRFCSVTLWWILVFTRFANEKIAIKERLICTWGTNIVLPNNYYGCPRLNKIIAKDKK